MDEIIDKDFFEINGVNKDVIKRILELDGGSEVVEKLSELIKKYTFPFVSVYEMDCMYNNKDNLDYIVEQLKLLDKQEKIDIEQLENGDFFDRLKSFKFKYNVAQYTYFKKVFKDGNGLEDKSENINKLFEYIKENGNSVVLRNSLPSLMILTNFKENGDSEKVIELIENIGTGNLAKFNYFTEKVNEDLRNDIYNGILNPETKQDVLNLDFNELIDDMIENEGKCESLNELKSKKSYTRKVFLYDMNIPKRFNYKNISEDNFEKLEQSYLVGQTNDKFSIPEVNLENDEYEIKSFKRWDEGIFDVVIADVVSSENLMNILESNNKNLIYIFSKKYSKQIYAYMERENDRIGVYGLSDDLFELIKGLIEKNLKEDIEIFNGDEKIPEKVEKKNDRENLLYEQSNEIIKFIPKNTIQDKQVRKRYENSLKRKDSIDATAFSLYKSGSNSISFNNTNDNYYICGNDFTMTVSEDDTEITFEVLAKATNNPFLKDNKSDLSTVMDELLSKGKTVKCTTMATSYYSFCKLAASGKVFVQKNENMYKSIGNFAATQTYEDSLYEKNNMMDKDFDKKKSIPLKTYNSSNDTVFAGWYVKSCDNLDENEKKLLEDQKEIFGKILKLLKVNDDYEKYLSVVDNLQKNDEQLYNRITSQKSVGEGMGENTDIENNDELRKALRNNRWNER